MSFDAASLAIGRKSTLIRIPVNNYGSLHTSAYLLTSGRHGLIINTNSGKLGQLNIKQN